MVLSSHMQPQEYRNSVGRGGFKHRQCNSMRGKRIKDLGKVVIIMIGRKEGYLTLLLSPTHTSFFSQLESLPLLLLANDLTPNL